MTQSDQDDARAIEDLIRRHFASLSWAPGRDGDWDGFARDFLAGAALFPAARPVRPQTVPEFVAHAGPVAHIVAHFRRVPARHADPRLRQRRGGARRLRDDRERHDRLAQRRGAAAGQDGTWKIAAQGWDKAGAERPVPAELLAP